MSDFTADTQPAQVEMRLITIDELAARPKPRFLVSNILVEGGISLLSGAPASFKSFVALDIALSIATGTRAFGYSTQQGRAVYIAAEGVHSLVERIDAWTASKDLPRPKNLLVYDQPLQLTTTATAEKFAQKAGAAKLIVVDTLARCAVGLDENDASQMGLFIESVSLLSRMTGAHVMVVHHNNKHGDTRGSTALPGAVDTHIAVSRANMSSIVTLTMKKQKDAEELPPFDLYAEQHNGSLALTSSTPLTERDQQALDALTHPMTATEWEAATTIPHNAFFVCQLNLVNLGIVKRDGPEGKRGVKYLKV